MTVPKISYEKVYIDTSAVHHIYTKTGATDTPREKCKPVEEKISRRKPVLERIAVC